LTCFNLFVIFEIGSIKNINGLKDFDFPLELRNTWFYKVNYWIY